MDTLALHIEYLLTRHDCVIVPGLGAFIATEKEAYIDLESGVIRPRRREVSFNSSVVTDDGLLTHSIARREQLCYEDARILLAHLTEKLTVDLNEEGEASLGMTGRLLMDEEGLISFQPRRSGVSADIRGEIKLTECSPAMAEDIVETAEPETPAEKEAYRTITVAADRYVFTISKRAVHAAAMMIAILTVGLSLLIPMNHDNEQKASVISIEDFFHRAVKKEGVKSEIPVAFNLEETDSIQTKERITDQ